MRFKTVRPTLPLFEKEIVFVSICTTIKGEILIAIVSFQAKASETIYADELRQRRDIEEALAKSKEEANQMKSKLNKMLADLQAAQAQTSSLERQLLNSDTTVQELEQKMFSAVDLLQKYRKERDELQVERDDALNIAEALREQHSNGSSTTSASVLFAEFYFHEIEEATRRFDPALKIGEGGYGSIYRGLLRHTHVAIKMLHPHSSQGPSEFQQEVRFVMFCCISASVHRRT